MVSLSWSGSSKCYGRVNACWSFSAKTCRCLLPCSASTVDPLPLCSSCFLPHIPEEFRGISTSDPVLCSSRMGFQTQPAPRHAWSLTNWPRLRAKRAEKRLTPPFWTLFWPVETIVGCLLSHTPAVLQIQPFAKVSRPRKHFSHF